MKRRNIDERIDALLVKVEELEAIKSRIDTFAVRLREARSSMGLSMGALASKARLGVSTIHYYERGEMTPGAVSLGRLAVALGVKSSFLWGEE